MTDPTESPTPESLVLAEIRERHQPCSTYCSHAPLKHCQSEHAYGSPWPCDTALVLAAYDERASAYDDLAAAFLTPAKGQPRRRRPTS